MYHVSQVYITEKVSPATFYDYTYIKRSGITNIIASECHSIICCQIAQMTGLTEILHISHSAFIFLCVWGFWGYVFRERGVSAWGFIFVWVLGILNWQHEENHITC